MIRVFLCLVYSFLIMSSGTIVALATPTGRSGIGVIRMSGSDALGITRKLVNDPQFSPETRYATLKQLHDPFTNEVIDEAIITYFKAPHSFTGEDVVEISCHGSPVLLRQVIDICSRLDARMAEAGGPTQIRPANLTASAKAGFSDRNP